MSDDPANKPTEPKKPPSKAVVRKAVMARLETAGEPAAILITASKAGARIQKFGNPAFLHGLIQFAYSELMQEEPPSPDPEEPPE